LHTNILIKFDPNTSKLRPETNKIKNTSTKIRKLKTSCRQWERGLKTARRRCVYYTRRHWTHPDEDLTPENPMSPSTAPKKSGARPHTHQGAESSQARVHYVPITDDRYDRCLRLQGRKTPGNAAGGRVSIRNRQRRVDLASKIKTKTVKKTGQKSRRRHFGSATSSKKTS